MDNLGYGEPGVYGGGILRGAPTPRIDELAAEGTRLTNFNVEAQCTPSRSAIMTGPFSIRSGTQSVPIGGEFDGLTRWEVTIADALFRRRLRHRRIRQVASRQRSGKAANKRGLSTNGTAFRARRTKPFGRTILRRRPRAFPQCT